MRPWAVIVRRGPGSCVVVLLLGGCFTDSGGTAEGSTSEAASTTAESTGGATSTTGPVSTSVAGSSGETTTSTTTNTTTTSTTDDPTMCGDPLDQPQDATCLDTSGCGCASGACFVYPGGQFGGWCGECLVDADCPIGGCTLPLPSKNLGAVCNEGRAGDGCMSDAVCNDPAYPKCGVLYDVPNILTIGACSQCASAVDCPEVEPHCAPDYALETLSGLRSCVGAATRANDKGCDSDGACASGFCGQANVLGILLLGVCGECLVDTDCPMGATCVPAMVDLNTSVITGAKCSV